MNDQHQGDDLVSRMGKIERRAIPEAWEDEIFAVAFPEEPERGRVVAWWLPPRWLGAGLAACWLGIAVLRVTAPVEPGTHAGRSGSVPSIDLAQREQLLAIMDLER